MKLFHEAWNSKMATASIAGTSSRGRGRRTSRTGASGGGRRAITRAVTSLGMARPPSGWSSSTVRRKARLSRRQASHSDKCRSTRRSALPLRSPSR